MQYLMISDKDTLSSISRIVGAQNIDALLTENGLTRSPNIGQQWKQKCESLLSENPPEVTGSRKASLLNALTGSEELFEKACLMDEDEWKIFASFKSFPDALKIPETVTLPSSEKVIGDSINISTQMGSGSAKSGASSGRNAQNKYGNRSSVSGNEVPSSQFSGTTNSAWAAAEPNSTESLGGKYAALDAGQGTYSGSNAQSAVTGPVNNSSSQSSPVNSITYRTVMLQLRLNQSIDPAVFNEINTSPAVSGDVDPYLNIGNSNNPMSWNLPWGKIQIYSSLLDKVVDIPAYPEEFETSRTANYTNMPDLIYQYEPWLAYQDSGPREQSLTFHLHRDMWTGDHRDGKANELIRFCEANTFPRYNGSAVLAPTVKIYIAGQTFISGVLTQTNIRWRGPIGLDDWPLDFDLSLTIKEVSEIALNIDSVSKFGLVGG